VIHEAGRRERPRRRRRGRVVRPLLALAVLLVVFGTGVAVGEALHDNPKPGGTLTYVHTLPPRSITQP
jgi:hypothetical protein